MRLSGARQLDEQPEASDAHDATVPASAVAAAPLSSQLHDAKPIEVVEPMPADAAKPTGVEPPPAP